MPSVEELAPASDVHIQEAEKSILSRLERGGETHYLPESSLAGSHVRVVEFEPEEISDETLREILQKIPSKKILKDPSKGFKRNKRHIKFADELETNEKDKPDLITLVLVDMEMCHYETTRGRKCPNSASREI